MTDLVVRMATESDQASLEEWVSTEPVAWVDAARFRAELASGNYRYPWSWLAERAGRPVGRALWWGSATNARPNTLDCLLVDDAEEQLDEVGAALVRAGLTHFGQGPALEFNVDVATDWAQDASAVHATGWRERAAHAGGLTRTTQRFSFARTSADPRPYRSGRLGFRSGSDSDFRALFAAVATGSLDAHTVATVARKGVSALADDDLAFYLSLPGRRDAWQIATLGDEDAPVGFVIPTRNAYDASISYLGVLPEHRGHGHVHELLAHMVHVHHDDGQDRIVGTTDATNHPMRAAFERAGFSVTRVRIVHSQDPDDIDP